MTFEALASAGAFLCPLREDKYSNESFSRSVLGRDSHGQR
jgi:hypothetical protein